MYNAFRSAVRFMVRHMGLTITAMVLLIGLIRGNQPISQMTVVVIGVLIGMGMVTCQMFANYSEKKPNPIVIRLAKPDVMVSMAAILTYMTALAGMLNDIN